MSFCIIPSCPDCGEEMTTCPHCQAEESRSDLHTWLCQIAGAVGFRGSLDGMSDHEIAAAIYRETVSRNVAASEVQKAIGDWLRTNA